MVRKMNKAEFIEELIKQTQMTEAECRIIEKIMESHFLVGKNNKAKVIKEMEENLNVSEKRANEIYVIVFMLIKRGIQNSLRHPFKDKK